MKWLNFRSTSESGDRSSAGSKCCSIEIASSCDRSSSTSNIFNDAVVYRLAPTPSHSLTVSSVRLFPCSVSPDCLWLCHTLGRAASRFQSQQSINCCCRSATSGVSVKLESVCQSSGITLFLLVVVPGETRRNMVATRMHKQLVGEG